MLKFLKINNFALIENAEVEFPAGFTVFTGESGAGKSILMSAIELLSGGRVGREGIRSGCKQFTVSGEFSIPPALLPVIQNILDENGIEFDTDAPVLTFRRVVGMTSTRNFINDVPVGAKLLNSVGSYLIDLHGANEQMSLTSPARQLDLLDSYGNLALLKKSCADCQNKLNTLKKIRSEFEKNLPDANEVDRLTLIVEEIEKIAPEVDEDQHLSAKQRVGANAKTVLETLNMLCGLLTENESSIADQLGSAYHHLSELSKLDNNFTKDALSECKNLQIAVSELSGKLAALAENVEVDPESLAVIEARLSELHTLKRRYGPTLEQVLSLCEKSREQLDVFKCSAKKRQEFDREEKLLNDELRQCAEKLSAARKTAANEFLDKALKKLVSIGFNGAVLEARFSETVPGASGMDKLELMFSANPGEAPRPLRKVASSGELSRLMLALKTVLADADSVPTVIFDEIDMNIGGETANKVGDELLSLGKKRQILCISHLAQVAARADNHFKVEKVCRNSRTFSQVVQLDDPIPELSRMLGGGDSATKHAADMHSKLHK